MDKSYTLYQVDSFTKELFKGNPAGVVTNADGLTDDQMQMIAREMNNSETAFIFSSDEDDHKIRIRFFTPKTEIPTCGHATIAAHYVRAIENNLPSCTIKHKIGIGVLPVDIVRYGNDLPTGQADYKIFMTQGKPEFISTLLSERQDEIISALDLNRSELNRKCPMQIVSTGHSKVMVGINNKKVLNSIKPDFSRLADISRKIKCNGFFVFTLDSDDTEILTHGRMFAPAIGINEDPVTGNAIGPLGAYLVKLKLVNFENVKFKFKAKQGEAIDRPGIVEVEVNVDDNGEPVLVKIGGVATIVFKTEFVL